MYRMNVTGKTVVGLIPAQEFSVGSLHVLPVSVQVHVRLMETLIEEWMGGWMDGYLSSEINGSNNNISAVILYKAVTPRDPITMIFSLSKG